MPLSRYLALSVLCACGGGAQAPPTVAPGCDDAWVLRMERRERTEAVGSCQIGPVDARSVLVAEARVLERGASRVTGVEIRVVQDDEAAAGMDAPESLNGRSFTATSGANGVDVRDASGAAPVDPTVAARVRGLAGIVVGWQGGAVVGRPAAGAGERVSPVEGAVLALFDAHLHGGPVPEAEAIVKVAAAQGPQKGDGLVLDVKLPVHGGDAGMCHTWTNDAELAGRLVLRRGNGAFVSLDLAGSVSNAEAVCQGDTTPRVCNRGSLELTVRRECPAGR